MFNQRLSADNASIISLWHINETRHGRFIPALSSLFAKLTDAFLDEELNAQIDSLQIHPLSKSEVLAIYNTGGSLAYQDLRGLDLRELDLTNIDLTGANLDGANLTKARLDNATLQNSSLIGTTLFKAILWNAQLDGADCSHADLRNASLNVDKLQSVTLHNTQFTLSVHRYSWSRRNRYEYHRHGRTWVRNYHYISDITISDLAELQKHLENPKGMAKQHCYLNSLSSEYSARSYAAAIFRDDIVNSSIGHVEFTNPRYNRYDDGF